MLKQIVSYSCVGPWIIMISDFNNEMLWLPSSCRAIITMLAVGGGKIGISINQLRYICLKKYLLKARKDN